MSGLLDAFWAYEHALLANDVPALDDAFLSRADTVRSDGTTTSEGPEQIAAVRRVRPRPPVRRVEKVRVVPGSADSALVMATVVAPSGTRGTQTQLWERDGEKWRIAAAHVSAPSRPIDPAVWRVVGAPLVPAHAEGPLSGVGVAVKDLFAVEGQRIGGGVPEFAAEATPEPRHADAVRMLLDVGAEVTGLAQTDQFAYGLAGTNGRYGTPLNVTAPDRVPGGSTSGGATAVALGWTDLALGTDTAGSSRVPAAYQRLWGMRTTHGSIPLSGVLPLAPSFDAVGLIAREGDMLHRAIAALQPVSDRFALSGAVVAPELLDLADADFRAAATNLSDAVGARQIALDLDIEAGFDAFRTLQAFEAWQVHGAWVNEHPNALSADVAARFAAAAQVRPEEAALARDLLLGVRAHVRAVVGSGVLILPAASSVAPALNATPDELESHRAGTLRLNCIASLAGLPAVSFPVGDASVGVIGPAGSDAALVAFAVR